MRKISLDLKLIHFESDDFSGYRYKHATQFSSWRVIISSPLGMPETSL